MEQIIEMLDLTDVTSEDNPKGLTMPSSCPSPCENCNCTWDYR